MNFILGLLWQQELFSFAPRVSDSWNKMALAFLNNYFFYSFVPKAY